MAQDPRKYLATNCKSTDEANNVETAKKRSFFDGLGKIGNIEALNDIGGGKIGKGLRSLASISNSVRDGKPGSSGLFGIGAAAGSILNSVNSSAEAATNAVLGAVGIDSTAASLASRFNPSIANNAFGQAKSIANKVKKGNFKFGDIPGALQDFQNLDSLIGGIFTSGKKKEQVTVCEPSPYAIDLAKRQPKFKFLFIVEFISDPAFAGTFEGIDLAFVINQTSRPRIEFEYEDINMYNFRTRVAKRTVYTPMSMRFYDDDIDNAFGFYRQYLNLMSPISNRLSKEIPYFQDQGLGVGIEVRKRGRDIGSSASLGALPLREVDNSDSGTSTDINSILTEIRLYHLFDWGRTIDLYQFFSPRVTSMEFDELNMAESGPTEFTLDFAYDGLRVQNATVAIEGEGTNDLLTSVDISEKTNKQNSALYPLHRIADIPVPTEPEEPPSFGLIGDFVVRNTSSSRVR